MIGLPESDHDLWFRLIVGPVRAGTRRFATIAGRSRSCGSALAFAKAGLGNTIAVPFFPKQHLATNRPVAVP